MAELYGPGTQKIYYHAKSGISGLVVTVGICRSTDEANADIIELKESEHFPGVYSFLFHFLEGIYLAAFFENGIRTISQVYRISRPEGTKFRGPNVVG